MTASRTRLRDNRFLQVILSLLGGLWIVTAIDPFNRRDRFLENVLVFVYRALLVATYRPWPALSARPTPLARKRTCQIFSRVG